MRPPHLAGFLVLLATTVAAQRGDRRGQEQPPLSATLEVPSAPVLAPRDALRSLRVQPGFEVQLIAAEPLVEDPVCIAFDEKGRIWAVEMRGFMPDVDGKGELKPTGRIVILSDTDGDGTMDRSQVFLENLVLPRVVSILNEGVLVLEPPKLFLCEDRDGDGKCDKKTLIRDRLGGRSGPEHAINGGMIGLDNWIQFAKFGERLRYLDGRWVWRPQTFRGQWGITQDDYGRAFHNSNSDYLRGDLFPAHYSNRNRNLGRTPGVNIQIDRDQSTWPIRITPGINRGYMKHMLRDFKLARFTAACSPVIYRDDVFPEDCHGDAFVCEPSGNFVRRSRITETATGITGKNAYQRDEFLASTDERFRPVDLKIGPDGGLYVVDMYRGILQHRNYVTTFLRRQIIERGLDKPVGLGRIYRVMPKGVKRRKDVDLASFSDRELVTALGHASGWRRDHAQRLLIGRGKKVATEVVARAISSKRPLARLHGLWVLEGLGSLQSALLREAIGDAHPQVRCAAIRLSEPWLAKDKELLAAVLARDSDPAPRVVVQVAHTLGGVRPLPVAALVRLASSRSLDAVLRGAILSGIQGQELEYLERLTAVIPDGADGRGILLQNLARCVMRERQPDRIQRMLVVAAGRDSWWRREVRRAVAAELSGESRRKKRERVLVLSAEPAALVELAATNLTAARIVKHLAWPGRPMQMAAQPKLTKALKRRFAKGKVHYTLRCFACHGMNGKGQPGVAPSLVGSEWILGAPKRVISILTHGLTGPIVVDGVEWNLLMPPVPDLGDAEIALILSYVRQAWGHQASWIDEKTVRRVRAAHAGRDAEPFTVEELRKLK